MFAENNFVKFGTITSTHGLKGNVVADLTHKLGKEIIKNTETIFVEFDGLLVPFFIDEFSFKKDNAILSFEDICSIEQSKRFIENDIYILNDELPCELDVFTENDDDLIGYKVVDDKFGEIGEVENINLIPTNPIIEIKHNNNLIMIPYHEDIIKEINDDEKTIYIDAPDGLIDIYL